MRVFPILSISIMPTEVSFRTLETLTVDDGWTDTFDLRGWCGRWRGYLRVVAPNLTCLVLDGVVFSAERAFTPNHARVARKYGLMP